MLDKKDEIILKLLKKNSKSSIKDISKNTLLPITTVHNRIKKLEKGGVIRNYTINLDDKNLETISAYVAISIDHEELKKGTIDGDNLLKKIRSHASVESASGLTGSIDVLVKVRVSDIKELDKFMIDFLKRLDGVKETNAMVILREI